MRFVRGWRDTGGDRHRDAHSVTGRRVQRRRTPRGGEQDGQPGDGDDRGERRPFELVPRLGEREPGAEIPPGFDMDGTITITSGPASYSARGVYQWSKEYRWNDTQDDDAFLYDCNDNLRSSWEDDLP
jgi:hypothetical protein